MQNVINIEEKRARVSAVLLQSLATNDGITTMRYNGLRFIQCRTGLWQDEDEGVRMSQDRVIDACVADDHRLDIIATHSELSEIAKDLNRLLNCPAVGIKGVEWVLVTTSSKKLEVVDTARGIMAVRADAASPVVDYMFYHPGLDTLGDDGWPSSDYERRTIGERMLDVQPVWPGKDQKVALCVDKRTYTFYPEQDGRLAVIVAEFDGTAICQITVQ